MDYTKVVQYISIERASHSLLYTREVEVNIVAVGKCYLQYVISCGTQYIISYGTVMYNMPEYRNEV
jgi:hypothetical protein